MTDRTNAQEPAEVTTETLITTNSDFLEGIFLDLQDGERPIVLDVRGPINAATRWGVGKAWEPGLDVDEEGMNWFFTLASFVPDDGKYRRRKSQFARAYGVYLDDVGTKAAPRERLDKCPPSYLIETSPGNFQAGYLFDEPCSDPRRVETLQRMLIEAGLCDAGANGPSARIGRLPFGVNGKYDPPVHCRLVEWQPGRRYSLDEIASRLDLASSGEVASQARRKSANRPAALCHAGDDEVHVPRAAENAVLTALRQRGLYKAPLGSGKHSVTCPWVHEHTGQIDHGTAYFEPSDLSPVGGFKCQHSHGGEKRIGALLDFLGVSSSEAKHKPTIRLAPGELHRVVDAAELELASGGQHYQRGGLIVTVVTDPGTGETKINPTSPNALMRALSACATWERYDARSNTFVVTDPAAKYVNILYDSESYRHLPVLRGIARQPYLRADGSLMSLAGYDPVSGMFGAFDEREFVISPTPTRGEAEQALEELRVLLREFNFAEPHDEAAALSLILTAAVRPTLPVSPMGHIKAPQIASGKSYLQSLVSAFAGPARPSAYAFPTNEEECAKLLLAALLEAPSVLVFDNLTSDLFPFKSLCSALTEEFLTGRVLGVSKTATVPTQTLVLSSGNNVDPVRDMTRRVVTVTLDPRCEIAATRAFNGDPLDTVRRERGRFVSLALTIVRAYLCADASSTDAIKALRPLASYGEWTRLVRAPLVWLGLRDPATSMFNRMAEDPDREALAVMLDAWERRYGDRPTRVHRVVEDVVFGRCSELEELVRDIAEERATINRRRLGRWIARHQGRVVDGRRFERGPRSGGSETWRVVGLVVSGVRAAPRAQSVPVIEEEVF